MARCLQKQGRYPEALDCRLRGLELERELLGESCVGSLLDLGDLYYAMHRNQEALAVYHEVEKRGVQGSKAATLAGNRATVLNHLGLHRQAEALHREALRLEEEESGPDHFGLVVPLRNLASELVERAPREALELLTRARALQTRSLGARHPDLARTLQLEACSLARAQRHAEAWLPMRQAVELLTGVLEPAHPDLVHSLRPEPGPARTPTRPPPPRVGPTRSEGRPG